MARAGEGLVGDQVGGRKAQLTAAFVAAHDRAAELEGRPQQAVGGGHVARQHEAADVARGDDLAVDLQQRMDVCGEALVGGEHARVALCLVAEAEVLADRYLPGLKRAHEHLVHELGRRATGEGGVEGDHDQLAHAQGGDQLGLALGPREQLGRVARGNHGNGVRLEGEHALGGVDHLPVAQVDPVEGAHRHAGSLAALHLRQGNDLHAR